MWTIIGLGDTVIETSVTGAGSNAWALQIGPGCENLTITGVTFVNTDVDATSAIAIKQNANADYTFDISDCTFKGYTTSIHLVNAAGGSITGCTFDSQDVDISVSVLSGMVTISGNTYTADLPENIGVLEADRANLSILDADANVVWH